MLLWQIHVTSLLVVFVRIKLLLTYRPGSDWLGGGCGGWDGGGWEFLWSELVVSNEAVSG